MTEQSGVGRTLLSDAFEFDFDPAFLSMKPSKSKAADKPALSEVEGSVRPPQARS